MANLSGKTIAVVLVVLAVIVGAAYLLLQPAPAPKPPKVGLILATGGLGDKSFNDISYAGVVRARDELGINFSYVEPKAIAEYEGFQRDFASTWLSETLRRL